MGKDGTVSGRGLSRLCRREHTRAIEGEEAASNGEDERDEEERKSIGEGVGSRSK